MSPTLLSYRPARLLFGLLIILICGQLSRAAAVAVENARARPPLPAVKRAKYDYVKAIHMIPLYFWAQRSGRLPYERLAWRSHSCSDCLGPNGEDLSGGWYEAANTMKFGHPFWHTFMQLGWITWAYEAELKKIGELDELRMWVRVGAEYTFKAHSAPDRLVAIHGIAEDVDFAWQGPPELWVEGMGQRRDQKKFSAYANRNQRASEIVGNAASAMATCFLSFKTIDRTYANKCLVTAKSLYNLASKYPGSFINGGWAAQSPSMNSHLSSYRSSGLYKDELANAAALLYLATNETSYLKFAKEYFNQALREYKGNLAFFSWDDKLVSTALLLCQINNRRGNGYELLLQKAFNFWLPDCVGARCKPGDGPSAKCKCIFRTPKGLTVGDSWGSLAAATNIGFLMMQHARWLRKFDVSDAYAVKLVNFVISQVNYVLGDNNGWSFMTGFGNKYPQHTYNVASYNSIIDFPLRGKRPDVIAQDYFLQGTSPQYDTPQRFIPYGAIQGGPDYYNDGIVDNHENYTFTENAQDYASAFLGAAIGLVDVYNLTTKGTDCGLDLGWNHPNANKAKRYPKYRKGDLYHTCG